MPCFPRNRTKSSVYGGNVLSRIFREIRCLTKKPAEASTADKARTRRTGPRTGSGGSWWGRSCRRRGSSGQGHEHRVGRRAGELGRDRRRAGVAEEAEGSGYDRPGGDGGGGRGSRGKEGLHRVGEPPLDLRRRGVLRLGVLLVRAGGGGRKGRGRGEGGNVRLQGVRKYHVRRATKSEGDKRLHYIMSVLGHHTSNIKYLGN